MGLDSWLIHTCTIQRAAPGTDAYHNPDPQYGPHYRDVPCRLVMKGQRVWSDEQRAAMIVTTYTLLVGAEVDLDPRDHISDVRLEDGQILEQTFAIRQLLTRRARGARHRSAVLEAIE